MKFFKEKNKILLAIACTAMLFVANSCVENESVIYGIDDEPNAVLGFPEKEAIVLEGSKEVKLQINTSKFIFNDATFDLILVSGDANGITFTDNDGNEGASFTIQKGTKSISLDVSINNDDIYTGNRVVTFALGNLIGEGVFIPEENIGNSENKLNVQFELIIEDDEPVPPSVGFNALSGEIDENATQPFIATIELTTPAIKAGSFDVNFSGTAIADTDYTSDAVNNVLSVNFAVGTKTIEIEITPIDNTIVDGDKTVILTISNLSEGFFIGEVSEYNLTIVGDDLPIKETTVNAEADAWTRGRNGSGKSDDNGGAKTDLVASDGNTDNDLREFYLKFDLTGIDPSKVTEAKIVLTTTRESNWANAETNFGGATTQTLYHVIDDSWGEMTITANTKPASDASPIATFTSDFLIGETTLSGLEHEFDVTAQLQVESDGKLSVRLNTVNTLGQRIFYASREHINNTPPKLVIVESL
tara:strand:+ start:27092 stop:28513 length:1422 start_codon:yes stop_codon:yes gene_type:complete